ncbi:histone-lysine N-methyltransferase SETMAR [Trichonephila clavipes]|nr:histone-lysine N-methyltransferase SETMAR [Trichonephila clavipes]
MQNPVATLGWERLHKPPYSPDLAPSDFHLFPALKKNLAGRRFGSNAEVKQSLNALRLSRERYKAPPPEAEILANALRRPFVQQFYMQSLKQEKSSNLRRAETMPAKIPLRHWGTLNSRRAASTLVWLVEGRCLPPQGFLPLNRGGTEQNGTVTCMVLKAKANGRRKNSSP